MKENKLKRMAESLSRAMGISVEAAREVVTSLKKKNITPDGMVEWSLPTARELLAAMKRNEMNSDS